jgi:murein tripeptide amidase MpaA
MPLCRNSNTKCLLLFWLTSFLFAALSSFAKDRQQSKDESGYLELTNILPPLNAWQGKSESLIQSSGNPWQTYAEKTNLTDTPNYAQTVEYFDKLVSSDQRLQKISLGKSPQGRDIWMIIASKEGVSEPEALAQLNKPTLLVQAGIHSGEIDGKDAGLMLLRDIVHGQKGHLIDKVNLLFVPILSVDAHERRSPFNRVNQRGPINMGWRTNASNLNLNRDYSKLDTAELRHLIRAINLWQPDLYFDVHVTDGEDYQYDITYGFNLSYADSPNIARWLEQQFKPTIDSALDMNNHKGGPLTFGVDKMEFSKGIVGWSPSPRFSNGYGDVRQLPTVLLENHSLKPYKQRVLGTYVFLESTLKLLATEGKNLQQATIKDKKRRPKEMVLSWQVNNDTPALIDFAGIEYAKRQDQFTGLDYIQWNGQAKTYKDLPVFIMNKPQQTVRIPKSYWIPSQYSDVIARLETHGIKIKRHPQKKKIQAVRLKVKDFQLKPDSFENRQMVSAEFSEIKASFELPANSVEVTTDQDMGRLVVALLDPRAPDSFFAWGFFNHIFQRTEYIESYALIPLAKKLFDAKPQLKQSFESRKKKDGKFASDQQAQMQWIYSQSEFYDKEYLLYPVLMSN